MSCAEALRRCPHAVFLRPRHRLYREYSRAVWDSVREVVPTVERTGMDEGYLDVGEVAADFARARVVAEAVQAAVRGATQPHVRARRRLLQGRLQDRERPAEARRDRPSCPQAARPRSSRRSTCGGSRGRPARRGAAAPRPGWRRSATWPRSPTTTLRALLPGQGRQAPSRPRPRDRPAPARARRRRRCRSAPRRRSRATSPRSSASRRSCAGCRSSSPSGSAARPAGRSRRRSATRTSRSARARRRSRSGSTTRTRIWELACACLDRALTDRPGALRLVGVAVSGLEAHRQLELV